MKYTEMTDEQKEADYHHYVLGKPKMVLSDYVVINGNRHDIPTWLWEDENPDNPHVGTYAGQAPPKYLKSLDLAMLGVEKMNLHYWELSKVSPGFDNDKYRMCVRQHKGENLFVYSKERNEAIVEACLRIVRPDLFEDTDDA